MTPESATGPMTEIELILLAKAPQEFDEREAALYAQVIKLEQQHEAAWDQIHRAAGDRRIGKRQLWKTTHARVLEEIQFRANHGNERLPFIGITPRELLDREIALQTQIAEVMLLVNAMEAVYRNGPWPRFYPCMNADGHIHSSYRGCPSVYESTDMRWYPQLSGKTVAEAVADLGPTLCSKCFPGVKPEWQLSKKDLNPGCPGSGRIQREGTLRRAGSRCYGKCQECNYSGQLTTYGYIRKHDPKNTTTKEN